MCWRPAMKSGHRRLGRQGQDHGQPFASDWGMVFGLRDGKIASFRVVEDTAQLAAAFRP